MSNLDEMGNLIEFLPQMLPVKYLPSGFRGDFQKFSNQKQELHMTAVFVNGSGRNNHSVQRTILRYFLPPSCGSFDQAVSERNIFRNRPTRNKNCLCRPCLLMNQNDMRNLKRGPSTDASYQDCVHLLKRVQRRGFCLEINQPETRIAYGGHVL